MLEQKETLLAQAAGMEGKMTYIHALEMQGGGRTRTAKSPCPVEHCGHATSKPAAEGDTDVGGHIAESTFRINAI